MRTYLESKITEGKSNTAVVLCTSASAGSKTVALLFSTKVSARLKLTTPSGSYPALSTSVRIYIPFEAAQLVYGFSV
jgi:hypothetical protein